MNPLYLPFSSLCFTLITPLSLAGELLRTVVLRAGLQGNQLQNWAACLHDFDKGGIIGMMQLAIEVERG